MAAECLEPPPEPRLHIALAGLLRQLLQGDRDAAAEILSLLCRRPVQLGSDPVAVTAVDSVPLVQVDVPSVRLRILTPDTPLHRDDLPDELLRGNRPQMVATLFRHAADACQSSYTGDSCELWNLVVHRVGELMSQEIIRTADGQRAAHRFILALDGQDLLLRRLEPGFGRTVSTLRNFVRLLEEACRWVDGQIWTWDFVGISDGRRRVGIRLDQLDVLQLDLEMPFGRRQESLPLDRDHQLFQMTVQNQILFLRHQLQQTPV